MQCNASANHCPACIHTLRAPALLLQPAAACRCVAQLGASCSVCQLDPNPHPIQQPPNPSLAGLVRHHTPTSSQSQSCYKHLTADCTAHNAPWQSLQTNQQLQLHTCTSQHEAALLIDSHTDATAIHSCCQTQTSSRIAAAAHSSSFSSSSSALSSRVALGASFLSSPSSVSYSSSSSSPPFLASSSVFLPSSSFFFSCRVCRKEACAGAPCSQSSEQQWRDDSQCRIVSVRG